MARTYRAKVEAKLMDAKEHGAPESWDWLDYYDYPWSSREKTSGVNLGRAMARRASLELCRKAERESPGLLGAPLFLTAFAWSCSGKLARLARDAVRGALEWAILLPLLLVIVAGLLLLRPRVLFGVLWALTQGDGPKKDLAFAALEAELDVVDRWWLAAQGLWKRIGGEKVATFKRRGFAWLSASFAGCRNDCEPWARFEAAWVCAWFLPFELLSRAWLEKPERAPRGFAWMVLGASPAPAVCAAFQVCLAKRYQWTKGEFDRRGLGGYLDAGLCGSLSGKFVVPAFRDEVLVMDLSSIWGAFGIVSSLERDALASPREDIEKEFETLPPWSSERVLDALRGAVHWRAWALAMPRIRSEHFDILASLIPGSDNGGLGKARSSRRL
jgi:hypothetical protein